MAIREDLVASAVTFLQDPSVSASPIENRIAFLQSKNLTQEEVDVALARAGGDPAPANYSNYAPQQQVARQPQNYGGYQQYPWQQPPPPELPKRDWRDWFIMATVMGGVGYGLYFVAKRYVVPLIAPPTPPQLEQDKASIDASFEKAFTLLDQLASDTEALKTADQARTERLDAALLEVETVIGSLKSATRRREEESRRITDEVRNIKDMIPKAMEGQKESTDVRLQELNTELKSLKKLMGQRMNPTQTNTTTASVYGRVPTTPAPYVPSAPVLTTPAVTNGTPASTIPSTDATVPKPATVSSETGTGTEATASFTNRSSSPFGSSIPAGRAAIPAWQRAAASKSSGSGAASPAATPATPVDSGAGSQEASSAA